MNAAGNNKTGSESLVKGTEQAEKKTCAGQVKVLSLTAAASVAAACGEVPRRQGAPVGWPGALAPESHDLIFTVCSWQGEIIERNKDNWSGSMHLTVMFYVILSSKSHEKGRFQQGNEDPPRYFPFKSRLMDSIHVFSTVQMQKQYYIWQNFILFTTHHLVLWARLSLLMNFWQRICRKRSPISWLPVFWASCTCCNRCPWTPFRICRLKQTKRKL